MTVLAKYPFDRSDNFCKFFLRIYDSPWQKILLTVCNCRILNHKEWTHILHIHPCSNKGKNIRVCQIRRKSDINFPLEGCYLYSKLERGRKRERVQEVSSGQYCPWSFLAWALSKYCCALSCNYFRYFFRSIFFRFLYFFQ